MSRFWLVAALAACSGPSRPAPADPIAVPTGELVREPSRICPGLAAMDRFRPWMSELFPACPPPGFGLLLPIGASASPCAATVESGGMRPGWGGDQTFTYDASGHLVSSTRDSKPALSCTWSGDHLDTCTVTFLDDTYTSRAIRDATGRLTAFASDDTTLALTYDSGRLTAIGDTPITYDASGRLTSVGAVTFTYDASGLPLTETDAHGTRTYHHDASGHLTRFDVTPQLTIVLSYDASGRLTTLRTGGPLEDSISYTHFSYDCAK